MTSSINLIHPSIHLCVWPPFLDLVLWPLPSLKASLFILPGCVAPWAVVMKRTLLLELSPPGSLL